MKIFTTKKQPVKIVKQLDNLEEKILTNVSPNLIRKPVIVFIFDDGKPVDQTTHQHFMDKGLRCSFAIVSTNTRLDEYLGYQNEGFEILSHSIDGTGMNDDTVDISVIENKMKTSKETLEAAGLNIKGWVTPSSTLKEKFLPALRKYYEFGYTKYFGEWDGVTGNPYNEFREDTCKLKRVSMESTSVENMKKAIDKTIESCGFLSFYAHNYSKGLTEEELIEVLDYVKEKVNNNECIVTTASEAYRHFFTLRHNDIINLL